MTTTKQPTGGTVFRIENQDTMQGLWYDKDGNFNPFIKRLSDAKCKELPMYFDPTYKDGGAWYSGGIDFPQMREWFHFQDVVELAQAGYHLYKFEVAAYRQVPGHVVFTRESIMDTTRLNIRLLAGED
jgi:hypothetical protein